MLAKGPSSFLKHKKIGLMRDSNQFTRRGAHSPCTKNRVNPYLYMAAYELSGSVVRGVMPETGEEILKIPQHKLRFSAAYENE